MAGWVRPVVELPPFVDADGREIPYGQRWSPGSPPDDSYSVVSHPERFAPLHTVADALVAHLRTEYDVAVDEDPGRVRDLRTPRPDALRAVRITPGDPACARLTVVFTAFPGLVLHAGVLHDFPFPRCACDACDSNWEEEADELERHLFAVVSGNFSERVELGRRPRVSSAERGEDWSDSGGWSATDLPADRLRSAAAVLAQLPADGWQPWPRSSTPA